MVRGDITVMAVPVTQAALQKCSAFTKCISKIDETEIDDAENLDLVVPMYSLIEYSSNYFEKSGCLRFYKLKHLILIITLQALVILNISSIKLNY